MKKTIILMAMAIVLLLVSCGRKEGTEILTKQIVYDVVINNQKAICDEGAQSASYAWFFENIEASKRWHFLENLFEKVCTDTASKDTLKITDDHGIKMALKQFKQRLIVYDSVRYHPPFLVCDTLIASTIGPNDILTLRFREKWTYDAKTMEITKKILAYAPLYFPNDPARPGKRVTKPVPLFWIQQDTNACCNVLLTDKMLCNVPFNDPPSFVNADSANCAKYMSRLSQFIYKDSIPAYIWDTWTRADLKLRESTWKAQLLTTKDQETIDSIVPGIYWKAFFGEENIDKTDPLYKQAMRTNLHFGPIECMCFVEEWYFNPVTMEIVKKVDQVGAVSLKHNYKGDIRAYIPSYMIKFNSLTALPKANKTKKAGEKGKK